MKYVLSITSFTICLILILLQAGMNSFAQNEPPTSKKTRDKNTFAPGQIEGMTLVWQDEFNIEGMPNSNNWAYEHGFVRNKELQWYQPANAQCVNGYLTIEGRKERVINPNYNPLSRDWRNLSEHAEYTSSCLITKGLQEWPSYGYFEIRARIDTSNGSWPAIWLLGTNNKWPECGEIDIMEFYRINKVPHLLANVAWGSKKPYQATWSSSQHPLSRFLQDDTQWSSKFHIWSMEWDKESIRLYIDHQLLNETMLDQTLNPDDSNPFKENNEHYLLLNLALGSNGGDPSDAHFPIKFEVDYVRVYKTNK